MKNKLLQKESKPSIIIIDIGCRWGFAERFLETKSQFPFKIYGFDPDKQECIRLQKHYQSSPAGMVTCVPLGLAGKSGKRQLYLTSEPACSSLHKPIKFLSDNYPALNCISLEKTIEIDVITLDEWGRSEGIENIDYIKLDTQGSELEILQGGEKLISSARCIDIEVEFNPIYEHQSLFGETDSYLRSQGFVLWRLSNLVHYSLGGNLIDIGDENSICFDENLRQASPAYGGQLFWADARYVKKDILSNTHINSKQGQKDIELFSALNMCDVIDHIKKRSVIL